MNSALGMPSLILNSPVTHPINDPVLFSFFQRVISQEKSMGGRMLDKPRSLLFQDGGDNLCISLEDVGAGWKCKGSYQV